MSAVLGARRIAAWFAWESDHPLWWLNHDLDAEVAKVYARIMEMTE
jgi:hypothetical protein